MTTLDINAEMQSLERMKVGDLQSRFLELFGEPTRSRHRAYLVRRIVWRLQANAEGGLSTRTLRRAAELADDALVRVTPPKGTLARSSPKTPTNVHVATPPPGGDARLPPPGSSLTREYRGKRVTVDVLEDGFAYAGLRSASLSAVAKAITGSHLNGFRFFGLGTTKGPTR